MRQFLKSITFPIILIALPDSPVLVYSFVFLQSKCNLIYGTLKSLQYSFYILKEQDNKVDNQIFRVS